MALIFCIFENLFILMSNYKKIEERLHKAVKQFGGSIKEEDGELLLEAGIAGTGFIFCYLPLKKTFIKVPCGIKAVIIDDEENEFGRILIYTIDGKLVEVRREDIIITGFD